jgi:chaperonin GroEL
VHASTVLAEDLGLTGDERTGLRVVREALVEPARWIAQNAGLEGRVAVNRVRESGQANHGLNAATGEYLDLVAAGVVDPVKVTRNAVRNAASIASMLLTTETLVADKPAEPEPAAGGGHGHSHGPGGHSHQHGPGF